MLVKLTTNIGISFEIPIMDSYLPTLEDLFIIPLLGNQASKTGTLIPATSFGNGNYQHWCSFEIPIMDSYLPTLEDLFIIPVLGN